MLQDRISDTNVNGLLSMEGALKWGFKTFTDHFVLHCLQHVRKDWWGLRDLCLGTPSPWDSRMSEQPY